MSTAMAVKAPPYPILVRQPDGSTITLYIKGDEFFHYAVADNGKAMVMDKDGFYRTAELPSAALAAAIREQNIMRFNAAGGFRPINRAAVSSSVKALIIPVEFKDRSFSVSAPKEHFHNMLNSPGYSENGGTGSAKDYFEANMPGMQFDFDVADPVRLSKSYAYYGENDLSTPSVSRAHGGQRRAGAGVRICSCIWQDTTRPKAETPMLSGHRPTTFIRKVSARTASG